MAALREVNAGSASTAMFILYKAGCENVREVAVVTGECTQKIQGSCSVYPLPHASIVVVTLYQRVENLMFSLRR